MCYCARLVHELWNESLKSRSIIFVTHFSAKFIYLLWLYTNLHHFLQDQSIYLQHHMHLLKHWSGWIYSLLGYGYWLNVHHSFLHIYVCGQRKFVHIMHLFAEWNTKLSQNHILSCNAHFFSFPSLKSYRMLGMTYDMWRT